MSHTRPMVGLSDSNFDSDLHNNEIDHDFFDNPCLETSSVIRSPETPSVSLENMGLLGSDKKFFVPDSSQESIGSIYVNGDILQALPITRSSEVTHFAKQPLNLSFTKPTIFLEDDLKTPDTCVSSPNLEYSLGHNQIFSTGKLLECLTQSDDLQGLVDFKLNDPQHMNRRANYSNAFKSFAPLEPDSSYLDYRKYEASQESNDNGFLCQDASKAQQHVAGLTRIKLFDVSSSSSDGSDSDSDPGSLDTEDEEFVDLLEKYYDYIDLGESDYSDITEVSPMSSLTASPLPPFNGINAGEDNLPLSSERRDSISPGLTLSFSASGRMPCNNHGHLFKPKPLPPLIIHTMEEVPELTEHNNAMYWPVKLEDVNLTGNLTSHEMGHSNKSSLSLLMKADSGRMKTVKLYSKDVVEEKSDTSEFQTSGTSSTTAINSKVPSRSTSSSACSRIGSSISTSSLTVNKRQGKNHTFTPDQLRRIEKDNSVLLRKILDTNKSHHGHRWSHAKGTIHHHRSGSHHQSLKASATIARQRQQRRIDHENSILIRRLQNAKPSKEIEEAFGTTNNNNMKYT